MFTIIEKRVYNGTKNIFIVLGSEYWWYETKTKGGIRFIDQLLQLEMVLDEIKRGHV
jgi:hypothetical protein